MLFWGIGGWGVLTLVSVVSLRLIAPVVRDHGIDYERGKFQDKLNDGSLTLARSEVWCFLCLRIL